MQIAIKLTEEEFKSGRILEEIEPSVIEYAEELSNGKWTRRAKLEDLDKLTQFKDEDAEFLSAIKSEVDKVSGENLSDIDRARMLSGMTEKEWGRLKALVDMTFEAQYRQLRSSVRLSVDKAYK